MEMKFNQEQRIQYLNMEAQFKELESKFNALMEMKHIREDGPLFADLCRRYAIAVIEITKMRAWVRSAEA
jgi:hypothetical protein